MLPTTGRFKDITCPYLETSCERPYCHFSHKKKTQETNESSTISSEVPTYNPTPKSQLLHTRSHIPISYVPDIVNRSDRSKSRFNFLVERAQNIQPIYKPTPLSILSSGGKTTNSVGNNQNSSDENGSSYEEHSFNNKNDEYNPESCNINFEELSTEFDLLDDIINSSESEENKKDEDINEESENNSIKSEKPKSEKKTKNKEEKVDKPKVDSKKESKEKYKDDKKRSADKKSEKNEKKSSDKHEKNEKKSNDRHETKISKKNSDKSSKKEKEEKKSSNKKSSEINQEKRKSGSENKQKSDRHHSHHSSSKERDKDKHRSKDHDKKREKSEKHKTKNEKLSNESGKKSKDKKSETRISTENLFDDELSDSNNSDNNLNLNDDLLDLEDDDDVMQECYKIFNEYKPTEPQIELQPSKAQEQNERNEVEYVPQGKKRIAHDKAEKITSRITINKPKISQNPALAMANRLKIARLAQAANEHKNLMAEINRQQAIKNNSSTQETSSQKSSTSGEISKRQGVKRPPDKSSDGSAKQLKLNSDSSTTSKSLSNLTTSKVTTSSSTSTSLIDDILSGKSSNTKPKRIAPAMNVNSIQRAKAKLEEIAKQKAAAVMKTPSQTFGKGGKRVAHVPDFSLSDIPDVLYAEKSKLPVNVRTRYLTMMADECLKLYLSKDDAYQRALNEELKCYERCSVLATYRNSAMLAINRLRKELQDLEKSGLGPLGSGDESRLSKDIDSELKGRKFYNNIKCFVLNEEELELHGYPREGPVHGRAVIKTQKQVNAVHLEEDERLCCRCSKIYRVDYNGFAVYEEQCVYHPLKKRTLRGESVYLCCKSTDEIGCVTAPCHVCDTPVPGEYDLEGYQTTFPPEDDDDPRSYAVYALDCEMCYTTKGLELTRVTIVNSECKTVYETLVKPINPIIDYNTRFSGITKEQMDRTATTILQVQANILHLCNSKTILIGHSLESDMRALKIVHSTIIDTSVMFPHKMGLPHKRALRVLASEYLKKIIQNDVSGHDSAEDALTCMELVIWKVKEELKSRGARS